MQQCRCCGIRTKYHSLPCRPWAIRTLLVYYLKLVQEMELKGALTCGDHSLETTAYLRGKTKSLLPVRKSQVYIFGENAFPTLLQGCHSLF